MASRSTSKPGPKPGRRRGPGRPAGVEGAAGRDALLRAARSLMTEKGLPRVTLREVAERAGVQPALVGYYFGGKDALLREVTAEVAAEMMRRIQESVSGEGSFEERLRRLIRGVVSAVSQDPYAPRLVVEQVLFADDATLDHFADRFGRANAAALTALLESGRRAGEARDVEPALFTPALIGMCVFFFLAAPIHQRIFGTGRITPELARRFADHTLSLLLYGLVPRDEARSPA